MKSSLIFYHKLQGLEQNRTVMLPQYLQTCWHRYFSRWHQQLLDWVSSQSEIKVWQTQDEFGNDWWHAFDPMTKMSVTHESEAEILAWLDSRTHS
jgi:hypothetical protein